MSYANAANKIGVSRYLLKGEFLVRDKGLENLFLQSQAINGGGTESQIASSLRI